jgi:CIC family chloride channel protein
LPVVNEAGALVGILTTQDIERAQADRGNGPTELTVGAICTRDLLVTYPDETLGAALRRMSGRDIGRLPVVAQANPRRLLGVLRRTDVIRAYDVALTRRAALRHQAHQAHLGMVSETSVVEVVVEAGAACASQPIGQVAWPRHCLIASVRRGQKLIIPRGDTILQAGDVLAVVAEGEAGQVLQRLCRTVPPNSNE